MQCLLNRESHPPDPGFHGPQERLRLLRCLQQQSSLLGEGEQVEVAFALTWFGDLPTSAKLQYIVGAGDMERKWNLLERWAPGSPYQRLRVLCVPQKGKQADVEGFLVAADFVFEHPEHLPPLQDHVHPTCKASGVDVRRINAIQ